MDTYIWGILPTYPENELRYMSPEDQKTSATLRKVDSIGRAKTVLTTDTFTVILCVNGDLFMIGYIFKKDPFSSTTPRLIHSNVEEVIVSYNLVFAKMANDKWYCLGDNVSKAAGVRHSRPGLSGKSYLTEFTECDLINEYNPVLLATGDDMTWFVTRDNNVYALGSNKSGSLGIGGGSVSRNASKPTLCIGDLQKPSSKVVKMEAGFMTFLVLLESGLVVGSGFCNDEMGGGNVTDIVAVTGDTPTIVPFTRDIRMNDISCRVFHCLWLSFTGDLYFSGVGKGGSIFTWSKTFKIAAEIHPIVFASGTYSTLVFCRDRVMCAHTEENLDYNVTEMIMEGVKNHRIDLTKIRQPTAGAHHGTFCVDVDIYGEPIFNLLKRSTLHDTNFLFCTN
jgi:hypothetical protein